MRLTVDDRWWAPPRHQLRHLDPPSNAPVINPSITRPNSGARKENGARLMYHADKVCNANPMRLTPWRSGKKVCDTQPLKPGEPGKASRHCGADVGCGGRQFMAAPTGKGPLTGALTSANFRPGPFCRDSAQTPPHHPAQRRNWRTKQKRKKVPVLDLVNTDQRTKWRRAR